MYEARVFRFYNTFSSSSSLGAVMPPYKCNFGLERDAIFRGKIELLMSEGIVGKKIWLLKSEGIVGDG